MHKTPLLFHFFLLFFFKLTFFRPIFCATPFLIKGYIKFKNTLFFAQTSAKTVLKGSR